jgi:hypothetical protein
VIIINRKERLTKKVREDEKEESDQCHINQRQLDKEDIDFFIRYY